MDVPRQRDDVLAQGTRARVFEELGELRRAAGTEELAARLGMHPNGVRTHLERLREAGLVVRDRPRVRVGRPRDMWSIAPGARPGGEPPTAYADLGRWLAGVVHSGKKSLRTVEASGRKIGRGLAPDGGAGSAEEQMHGALVALGFAPEREVDPPRSLTYLLGNCPYRDVARDNQQVVCTLHRGVTRGLLDELSPDTRLAGFVPRDPETAGCLIELRDGLAEEPGRADEGTGPRKPLR
jgi:predicted ArsR family transcriptional regulator